MRQAEMHAQESNQAQRPGTTGTKLKQGRRPGARGTTHTVATSATSTTGTTSTANATGTAGTLFATPVRQKKSHRFATGTAGTKKESPFATPVQRMLYTNCNCDTCAVDLVVF